MISRRQILTMAGLGAAAAATTARAATPFCDGFKAGFKAAYENRRMIPAIPPICPIPNLGGNTYQHGFERGMLTALAQIR